MAKKTLIKPCIIGLGYVGLPIYMALSKKFETCGFDINKLRVKNLQRKIDENLEFKKQDFSSKNGSFFTNDTKYLGNFNFFIITVPTPLNKNYEPDLSFVTSATATLSKILKKGSIVILESTVYPGVTENLCKKIIEKNNRSMKENKNFYLGYSPERINPGDDKHRINKINKIVAFRNKEKLKNVIKVYKNLGKKIIYTNKIKEAETAKVIENIQRDLNISLINELYKFCDKAKIDFKEVIKLASTKWNFIKFNPGLVGGHCLPVDPYYFSFIAKKNSINTKVTLAGRETNNEMEKFIFLKIKKNILKNYKNKNILIAGLTYKANVPDMRNSLSYNIFIKLRNYFGKKYIDGFEPLLDKKKARIFELKEGISSKKYECIYVLTNHKIFKKKFKKNNTKYLFQNL